MNSPLSPSTRLEKRDVQAVRPLSPTQAGLVFHSVFAGPAKSAPERGLSSRTAYHQQAVFALTGCVVPEVLRAAWQAVVHRHDSLRSAFVWRQDREPLQVVLRPQAVTVPWQSSDWRDQPAAEQVQNLERWLREDHARGYDLSRAPLVRLLLAQLSENQWYFVFSHHHLVVDGWSNSIVLKQVAEHYQRLLQARETTSVLPADELAPADAVASPFQQRLAELREVHQRAAEAFYRDLPLAECAEASVPGPAPGGGSANGCIEYTQALSEQDTAQLQAIAASERTTLNALVQSVWALVLGRATGRRAVSFGVVVAGRPAELPGAAEQVGLFINSLPLPVGLSPTATGRQLLRQVQLRSAGLLRFELADARALQYADGRRAGFETLYVFDNFPSVQAAMEAAGPGALSARPLRAEELRALGPQAAERNHYALTLVVVPGARLQWRLAYDTERVDASVAQGLQAALQQVLTRLSQPESARHYLEQPLGCFTWSTDARDVTAVGEPARSGDSLLDRLARFAETGPERVALCGAEFSLNWRQLQQRVHAVARGLRKAGLQPEQLVALALDRSEQWVVAALGVLAAGGAYVPVDRNAPRARTSAVLSRCATRWAVVPPGEERSWGGVRTWTVGELEGFGVAGLPEAAGDEHGPVLAAEQLAYVLHTSGSSGGPKAVGITHGNIQSYSSAIVQRLGLHREQRVAWVNSPAADLGNTSVLGALWAGATLVVAPPQIADNADWLGRFFQHHAVDVVKIAPSHWLGLLRASAAPEQLIPQQMVVFGGERLSAACVHEVQRLSRGVRIFNHYGPTETTVGVLVQQVVGEQLVAAAALGTALGGHARVAVLDASGQPQLDGLAGQLSVSGAALARGYLGSPSQTAERFTPDPQSAEPGQRRYATGDRVQRRAGQLYFLGRLDQQLKVHGFRVEAAEVEGQILQCEGVSAAAVRLSAHCDSASEGEGRGGVLQGLVVMKAGAPFSPERLRAQLSERLPAAWVPTQWLRLTELPLLPSGKLDRRALDALSPPATAALSEGGQDDSKPRAGRGEGVGGAETLSATEQALLAVFRQVLHKPSLGCDDNFFQQGGDSIKSLQVVARARRAGYALSPKQVFDCPSVSELAPVVQAALCTESEGSLEKDAGPLGSALSAASDQPESTAVSPIAQWFFSKHSAAPSHFNQSVWLAVREELDEQKLQSALRACLARHPALGSRFVRDERGRVRQHWPEGGAERSRPCPLRCVRLPEDLPSAQRWIESEAQRAQSQVSLEHGPLFRAVCFSRRSPQPLGQSERTAATENRGYLLLVAHHLVVDAVSWSVLLPELATLYAGETLPEAPGNSVRWAQCWPSFDPAALLRAHAYFADQGQGQRLPPPLVNGPSLQGEQCVVHKTLSAESTQALFEQVPQRLGLSVDDVLSAALVRVLGRYGGLQRVAIEREGHGRQGLSGSLQAMDLSRSVGWFTTRYPWVVKCSQAETALEHLLSVRDQLRAIPDQGRGYGILQAMVAQDILPAGYDSLRQPLPECQPEVVFNYLGDVRQVEGPWRLASSEDPLSAPSLRGVERDPACERAARFSVGAQREQRGLTLQWLYGARHETRQTVQQLVSDWATEIEGLVQSVEDLPRGLWDSTELPFADLSSRAIWRLQLDRNRVQAVYALTALQQGLLFEELKRPGTYQYTLKAHLAEVHPEALQTAFAQLMHRHQLLRSKVVWQVRSGPKPEALAHPVAVVYRPGVLPPPVEVQVEPSPSGKASSSDGWQQRPVDLNCDLPWRVTVRLLSSGGAELLWQRHHLVSDGWSSGLLLAELQQLYAAAVSKQTPPPTTPESDHALDQYMRWLQTRDLEAAKAYFAVRLARLSGPTPLPLASAIRPSMGGEKSGLGPRPGVVSLVSDEQRSAAWQGACAAAGWTLNTLVQGAWALLLSRHGSASTVAFGVTVSGRPAEVPGIERCVGVFVNTLPLVVQLPAAQSVGCWLTQLQADNVAMREHDFAPLFELGAEQRRATELLSSLVVFENYPVDEQALRAGPLRTVHIERHEGSHFPLMLVAAGGQTLRLALHYDPTRYSQALGEQLLEQLACLMDRLAGETVQCPLGRIGLPQPAAVCPPAHRGDEGPHETLAASFARVAHAHWDQPALTHYPEVESGGQPRAEHLTYGQLWQRVQAVARSLRRQGVGPEVGVAIGVERSAEQLVALLGVLVAGGYYVPFEPNVPRARQRHLCESLGVRHRLEPGFEKGLESPLASEAESKLSAESFRALGGADCLAYVLHTSGSTGEPKAVGVAHRQVQALFAASREHYDFDKDRVWSYFHSYAFDFSVWELWGAWLHGGRVVAVPGWARRDNRQLLQVLREQSVEVLSQTPSAFYALTEALLADPQVLAPQSLRTVTFGGEALDESRLSGWFAFWKGRGPRLINQYGITETTVHVTAHEVKPGAVGTQGVGPGSAVGSALRHGVVRVLDAWGNALPCGAVGELVVGGHGLSRGYLGRPGRTAAAFVPDPQGAPGARAYRSGDLGRWGGEGQLLHCGRRDDQVQLRGHRVEPGEIAACLRTHDAVREAVVVVRDPDTDAAQLVAYVTLRRAAELAATQGEPLHAVARPEEDWLEYVAERLPPYMVPSRCLVVDQFSVTANGKLDLGSLPDPGGQLGAEAVEFSEVERQILPFWQELLAKPPPSPSTNFFDAGGHSLLAMRLLTRVRSHFGVEASMAEFVACPTLRQLARQVSGESAAAQSAVGELPPGDSSESLSVEALADLLSAELAEEES